MAAKGYDSNQDARENECAQTLLELATSVFCVPKISMPSPPNTVASSYNRSPESSAVPSVVKRPARTRLSSSPKRKRTSPTVSPPHNFKPNCVMKRKGVSRGQMYNELVMSIKLDHSYATGSAKNEPDIPTGSAVDENSTVSRPSISLLSNPRSDKLATQQPDLFKSDDANYENFNLLLKCLTNVEEPYSEQKKQTNGKGKSTMNNKKDGNSNDLSANSEEVLKGDSHFKCKDCPKSFTKKRYLIKHAQRMHNSSVQTGGNTLCRHCEQYIPQAELTTHSCPAQELANCSFCGLRLRSNVLEKHLVQEHGMERSVSDDGGSSTISGSEHGPAQTSPTAATTSLTTTTCCVLCKKNVHASTLHQHIYDEHVHLEAVTNCPLCRLPFSDSGSLIQHIVSSHCPPPPPVVSSRGEERGARCKHSMLPRFLHDSSGGGGIMDGGEQCAQCVGSLVTSMSSSSPSLQCSLSASNLLERTTTELIEAALQYAGK